VPASAVIPAPIVYLNIAAVKKLVVTSGRQLAGYREVAQRVEGEDQAVG